MIASVIVTFHPHPQDFAQLLRALGEQTEHVIVVDNSPRGDNTAWEAFLQSDVDLDKSRFVRLGVNAGVGKALNVGADLALQMGAESILLSDQDSLPAPHMVDALEKLCFSLSDSGHAVGAVGPAYTDLHTQRPYPFQTVEDGRKIYAHRFPEKDSWIETISLITSGSLIPRDVYLDVGPMNEDLFIDYVDVEWCFRAIEKGYKLYGSGKARMYQRMGEDSLRVWYFKWRSETRYPPQRIYYRVRNHLYLIKHKRGTAWWRLRSSWYIAGVVYTHILFGNDRWNSLKMSVKGVFHALKNRYGALD